MLTIDTHTLSVSDMYHYLSSAIAPRPIAFVSTIDAKGNPNLAPFSFFNVVSSVPPTLVFCVAKKQPSQSTKDTLLNVETNGEAVVNMVSYEIARQMGITSIEFPENVSEFKKAGLTPIASDLVKPFRVKESPVQFECKVKQIIPLDTENIGAGYFMVVCNIVRMHIHEDILDEKGRIAPEKIDLVGRFGGANYTRSKEGLFEIRQAQNEICVGFDNLPKQLRNSNVLTGNNLALIAGLTALPNRAEVLAIQNDNSIQKILHTNTNKTYSLHYLAKEALEKGDVLSGAKIALLAEYV
jgi:flavin reductase (DIM6/NTAB) family NADH-FMN oxidoreductase RutF